MWICSCSEWICFFGELVLSTRLLFTFCSLSRISSQWVSFCLVPFCAAYFVTALSGSYWRDTTSWRGSLRGWKGPRWRSWMYSTTSSWSCRRTSWWRPTGNAAGVFRLLIWVAERASPRQQARLTWQDTVCVGFLLICPRFTKSTVLPATSLLGSVWSQGKNLDSRTCRFFINLTAFRREQPGVVHKHVSWGCSRNTRVSLPLLRLVRLRQS